MCSVFRQAFIISISKFDQLSAHSCFQNLIKLTVDGSERDGNGQIDLFWGIAVDGFVVISVILELIKASCVKSFAPFPTG